MRLTVALGACALALSGVYVLFVWAFPLRLLFATPQQDIGSLSAYRPAAALLLAAGLALVFALYAIACRLSQRLEALPHQRRSAMLVVLLGAVVQGGVLLWAYPVGAVDVYDYIYRAKIWVTHGLNPLTTAPVTASDDAWYPFVAWAAYPSPYGPVWLLLTAALQRLAGASLLSNLAALKLFSLSALIGAALLAARRKRDGRLSLAWLVFVLWNPLAVFETGANAHNDVVMALLLVAALRLHLSGRAVLAWLCAALAVHSKIAALIVLPAMLVGGARRAGGGPGAYLREALSGGVWLVLVSIAVYAPFWSGWETFDGIRALQGRDTSSLAAAVRLGADLLGVSQARVLTQGFCLVLLAVCVIWLSRSPDDAATLAYRHAWLLLVIATFWFQPWYVLWVLLLAPLARQADRLRLAAVSAGSLLLYLLFGFAWQWYPDLFNWGETLGLNACAVGLWLGLPLTACWIYVRRRTAGLPPPGL